jgi:hypothetical protein
VSLSAGSLSRVLKVSNKVSVTLWAAGLCLLMLTLSSLLQPTIGLEKFTPLLVVSLEIMSFLTPRGLF